MEEKRMLILMTGTLTGEEGDLGLFERLEDDYLNTQAENALFILGADLLKCDRRTDRKDKAIFSFAEERIRFLRARYGAHFGVVVRERRLTAEGDYAPVGGETGLVREVCSYFFRRDGRFAWKLVPETDEHSFSSVLLLESGATLPVGMLDVIRTEAEKHPKGLLRLRGEPSSFAPSPFSHVTSGFCGLFASNVEDFVSAVASFPDMDLDFGLLLGAATAPSLSIPVVSPKTAASYFRRQHEKVTKDINTLLYGMGKGLGKSLFVRLLFTVRPLLSLSVLLLVSLLGGWKVPFFLFAFLPELLAVFRSLQVKGENGRAFFGAVSRLWFCAISLAFEAILVMNAFWRVLLGKEKSETPPTGDRVCLDEYILRFSPSMTAGLIAFFLHGLFSKLIGVLWMLAPFYFYVLSREKKKKALLCERDRTTLLRYSRDMWLFFEEEALSWGFAPAMVQFSPPCVPLEIVTPTGMGMQLLSCLGARELGFLDRERFYEKILSLTETVFALFKWQGHPFCAYRWETGKPSYRLLAEESVVFWASLAVFAEGLRDHLSEDSRLSRPLSLAEEMLERIELSFFYDAETQRIYEGFDAESGQFFEGKNEKSPLLSYLLFAETGEKSVLQGGITGSVKEDFLSALFLPASSVSSFRWQLKNAIGLQKRRALKKRLNGRRYRLFGTSESAYFSFDGEMRYLMAVHHAGDAVIAPYASFLMAGEAAEDMMENLRRLESLGIYGKYGFYDAVDFAPSRVGGGYAKLEAYSAVHQGMSFVAAADLLLGGLMKDRFLRIAKIRAKKERLFSLFLSKKRKKIPKKNIEKAEKPLLSVPKSEKNGIYTVLHPDISLLSNNRTKLFLSSSGHVLMQDGRETLLPSDFDLYSLREGLRIYWKVDGTVLPTVPLGASAERYRSDFSFHPHGETVLLHGRHRGGGRCVETILRWSLCPDRAMVSLELSLRGSFSHACVYLFARPFGRDTEASFYAEERILTTRTEEKGKSRFFGFYLGKGEWETPRDAFFREEEYASFGGNGGEALDASSHSLYVLRHELSSACKERIVISFGTAEDAEELVYLLSKRREMRRCDALSALQYGAAGLSFPPYSPERAVLRALFFGQLRPRTESLAGFDLGGFRREGMEPETPLLLAEGFREAAGQEMRLRELVALFKYMCIRGVRYALVILYRGRTARDSIFRTVRRAGCGEFLGFSRGIFAVDEDSLTREEKFAFSLYAFMVLDLGLSLDLQTGKNARAVPLSDETERKLLCAPLGSPACGRTETLHSAVLSAFLGDRSLGYTVWTVGTGGKLTSRDGEQLLLRIYETTRGTCFRDYDLAGCAAEMHMEENGAVFTGQAGSLSFSVCVSVCGTEKRFSVQLQGEEARRATLYFRIRPAIGQEAPPRFYRFRRGSEGLRITKFCDGASSPFLTLSSSVHASSVTETAALRSGGAVFRGEEDIGALSVDFTPTEESFFVFTMRAEGLSDGGMGT